MSLLGRLLTPLNVMVEDPNFAAIVYIFVVIGLMLITITFTITLDFQPWALRLTALLTTYYLWFNYNNHYKLTGTTND